MAQDFSEEIKEDISADSEAWARQEICRIGRLMYEKGMIAASDGNLSVRLGRKTVLCTPTGAGKGQLQPEQLVLIDLTGKPFDSFGRPSSEIDLHLSIYRENPAIRAVVHAHPRAATAFAVAERPLDQPILTETELFLGPVPLIPYATPGSPAVGALAAPACRDYNGALLAHHGAVTWGTDLEQAWFRMEVLEQTAQIQQTAEGLPGGAKHLAAEEVRRLAEKRQELASRRPISPVAGPASGETVDCRRPDSNQDAADAGTYQAVRFDQAAGCLVLLDQTLLPGQLKYRRLTTAEEVRDAIQRLVVRGAPAIGLAGAYGLYLTALYSPAPDSAELRRELDQARQRLAGARPTAVNLSWALNRMWKRVERAQQASPEALREILLASADALAAEDAGVCFRLGEAGLTLLKPGAGLLTHCNAGALATACYGTALAPILLGQERGYAFKVFADETRPLLQGARLTAWELQRAKVDVTLICDNMAAAAMQNGWIDAVLVGCDRVAANGDTANKIGTAGLARLASSFGIPFYVFAPTATIDMSCADGTTIPIEERAGEEITRHWFEQELAPAGVKVWNPAFDVTPAQLITAIVTEKGILRPPYEKSLFYIME